MRAKVCRVNGSVHWGKHTLRGRGGGAGVTGAVTCRGATELRVLTDTSSHWLVMVMNAMFATLSLPGHLGSWGAKQLNISLCS